MDWNREYEPDEKLVNYGCDTGRWYLKLWKVFGRMGDCKFPETSGSNISSRLFRVLRVLEQRHPKYVCNSF